MTKVLRNISTLYLRPVHFCARKLRGYSIVLLVLLLFIANPGRGQVVINEVGIAPSGGAGNQYIELFNRSACAVDISCYTIAFSSISGGGNPTGWTIKIPSGSSIPACGYFLIGGEAGSAGAVANNGYPTGGVSNLYPGSSNLNIGNPVVFTNTTWMLLINPGTYTNTCAYAEASAQA